ncbi:MAG: FtsX-like permease family protein [Candidatus Bathyarchaeia archaeon]
MLREKLLLRKRGTTSTILALALLAAIIASMNSVVNYFNAQSEALAGLVQIGETYLIINNSATAPTNSKIEMETAKHLSEIAEVNQAFPQKLLTAHLKTDTANLTVTVRAVETVEKYLKFYKASLNGTHAKKSHEANIGELLARTANVTINTTLTLTTAEKTLNLTAVGIHRTQSQLDSEILTSLTATNSLSAAEAELSIIEFTLKTGVNRTEALTRLAERLPASVKIVKVQQPTAFMQNVNTQTLAFLNLWSLAAYAVIAAASYTITARLTAESAYELAMLKALGASKRQILTLIIGYIALTATLASILGVALGLTAAQAASTLLRWLQPTMEIAPFLQPEQALKAMALTLTSAVLGSIIPAYKASRLGYVEQPL